MRSELAASELPPGCSCTTTEDHAGRVLRVSTCPVCVSWGLAFLEAKGGPLDGEQLTLQLDRDCSVSAMAEAEASTATHMDRESSGTLDDLPF